ncbi:MAG: serine/threonine protein kinase [Planctomycetes bacterium]|nr:serine/threonine protein kinase [Planctomycetota bacterium]
MKICLQCDGVTDSEAQCCGHCGSWLLPTDAVHYPVRTGEVDAGNPLLGTVVDGKYRLLAVLGRGGLGTVFRAQHVGSLMAVALKLLHPRFAARAEYRRSLLPEARRAATVAHQRCARLLDVGEAEDGQTYLAMELVDGRTLDGLWRSGPLAPAHAVAILLQVAEALVAIHAAELVHCDLSPRNVMVAAADGRLSVKVLDFGIARSMHLVRPGPGELAGFVNPAFSAPELLAGQDVDPRADLFSLGTIGWLLLTGAMPVDAPAGRRSWPGPAGVPRRLVRLLQDCLQHDPSRRPASAAQVAGELAAIAAARRPFWSRLAVTLAVLATGLAFVARGSGRAPYLRVWPGSALALAEVAPGVLPPVQHLQGRKLATFGGHFGGFAARSLRAELSRDGHVLLRQPLRPEIDAADGALVLSDAQEEWRDLLEAMQRLSLDGPVDVTFVAPGVPPLGTARLRLDDEAPQVEARLEPPGALNGTTQLVWRAEERHGLAGLEVVVQFRERGPVRLPIPPDQPTLPLGVLLQERFHGGRDLGPGDVELRAVDLAGNAARTDPLPFPSADLACPRLLAITGPGGEPFLLRHGDVVHARLQVEDLEPGCMLTCQHGERHVTQALPSSGSMVLVELPAGFADGDSLALQLGLADPAGNTHRLDVVLPVRDRTLRPVVVPCDARARWLDGELVIGPGGADVDVSFGPNYALAGAPVELASGGALAVAGGASAVLPLQQPAGADGTARLSLATLPPGAHRLLFELTDRKAAAGASPLVVARVPCNLRVLPEQIDVQLPVGRPRFLAGALESGLLVLRESLLRDGAAWRLDPSVRPYLSGTLWLGATAALPLSIGAANPGEPLLPEIAPVFGRNVLAVQLVDVLGRPVAWRRGDETVVQAGPVGIADFWYDDRPPEPIGEELLVEHGEPLRVSLRLRAPFVAADLPALRLGVLQTEVLAARLDEAGSERPVVVFDLPFPVWSLAAQLADRTREQFAEGLERRLEVALSTPAGRHTLSLRLRTVRSTLVPVTLQELGAADPVLGRIRLLPVLAPAVPFAEPVPDAAPPRALYRPQIVVAVRNLHDLLLQDRELQWGEAKVLVAAMARLPAPLQRSCLHALDPLGAARTDPANLLPSGSGADDESLCGVDFFQAYALVRGLGAALFGDPERFRLPFGCELVLAAYARAQRPAAHGAAAAGGAVASRLFTADWGGPGAAGSRRAGDVVPSRYGFDFVGLDFGVREWVLDLPADVGSELLVREWLGDHQTHLERVTALANGRFEPAPDPAGAVARLGVVRGLGSTEPEGLIGEDGQRLDVARSSELPAVVPGVLRAQQLYRDGRDLLGRGREPLLQRIGLRIAADARAGGGR